MISDITGPEASSCIHGDSVVMLEVFSIFRWSLKQLTQSFWLVHHPKALRAVRGLTRWSCMLFLDSHEGSFILITLKSPELHLWSCQNRKSMAVMRHAPPVFMVDCRPLLVTEHKCTHWLLRNADVYFTVPFRKLTNVCFFFCKKKKHS